MSNLDVLVPKTNGRWTLSIQHVVKIQKIFLMLVHRNLLEPNGKYRCNGGQAKTLGNWWDGYLRNAYMTDNKLAIDRINDIVKYVLSGQDEDGYLGIYSKKMRYQHKGSNGELWSQTVLFRMLLGYYEFTEGTHLC